MTTQVGGWLTLAEGYDEREFTLLWLVAAATYGVGDVVTTVAIAWFSRTVREGNPLVAGAIEAFGQGGLIGLKLGAFLLCIAISLLAARARDDTMYYLPPAVLSVVGFVATAYNLVLLL
jgi:hypothetical protein